MATSITDKTIAEWAANSTSTKGLAGTMASWANEDPIVTQTKFELLASNKAEKTNRLSNIVGLYDADSPRLSDGSTTRITESTYYAQAPELKDATGQLTRAGINARIMADNYAMGMKNVPKYDANSEIIDPRYYNQYREAMDALIKERVAKGQYNVYDTGTVDSLEYGRKLVKAQSSDMPMSQTDFLLQHGAAKKVDLAPTKRINMDNIEQGGKSITQQLMELSSQPIENKNTGTWNELGQVVAGAASGVATGAIDLLDAAQELGTLGIQTGYNKITGKNVDIDLIDDKKKESAKKWINELVGYDAQRDEASMQKTTALLGNLGVDLTNPKTWNILGDAEKRGYLLDAITEVITNPSLTAHGVTQIFGSGITLGAGTKLATKVISKVSANTAKLADDMLTSKLTKTNSEIATVKADSALDATTKAAKIKELKDSVGVANTLGHYVKGTTFSNADFAVRANDHITKFKEANGGEGPELDKLTSILLIDRTLSALEVASMKNVIGLDGSLKDVAKNGLITAAKKAAKHMLKSVPQEGIQEGLDAIGELVNTKYDTAAYKDMTLKELVAKESDNIMASILTGAAGGAHMATPGLAYNTGKALLGSRTEEKMNEVKGTVDSAVKGVTAPQQVDTPVSFEETATTVKAMLENPDMASPSYKKDLLSKLQAMDRLAVEDADKEKLEEIRTQAKNLVSASMANLVSPDGKVNTTVFGSDAYTTFDEMATELSYADEGTRTKVVTAFKNDERFANIGKALEEINATSSSKAEEVLDGIAAVQNEITKGTFVTSKNTHRSMIDNYKLASSTNEDEARIGIEKLNEFKQYQTGKVTLLQNGKAEAVNAVSRVIDRIAADSGLDIKEVVKAIASLESLTYSDDPNSRVNYIDSVKKLTGEQNTAAAKKAYKARIRPLLEQAAPNDVVRSVSYAMEFQSKNEGYFEITLKDAIGAYAEQLKIKTAKTPAISRLVNAINAEVEALDTLAAMASRNREAKSRAAAEYAEVLNKIGIKPAELGEEQPALPNEPGKVEKDRVDQLVKEEAIAEKAKQPGRVQEDGTVAEEVRAKVKDEIIEERKAPARKPITEVDKAKEEPAIAKPAVEKPSSSADNKPADTLKDIKTKVKDALDSKAEYKNIASIVTESTLSEEDKHKLLQHIESRIGKAKIASDATIGKTEDKEKLEEVKAKVDRKIQLFLKLIKDGKEIYTSNRSKLGKLYNEIKGYQKLKRAYYKEITRLNRENYVEGEELKKLEKELEQKKAKLKAHENAIPSKLAEESDESFNKRVAANEKMLKKIANEIAELEKKITAAKTASATKKELQNIATSIDKDIKAKELEARQMAYDEVDKLQEKRKKLKLLTSDYSSTGTIVYGPSGSDTGKPGVRGKNEAQALKADGKSVGSLQLSKLFKPSYGSKLSGSLKDASKNLRDFATGIVKIIDGYALKRGELPSGMSEDVLMREDMSRALLFDPVMDGNDTNGWKTKGWKINENVAAAIGIATTQELESVIIQLAERDDEVVAKYYGVDPTEIDGDRLEELKALGIPVKYLTESIGKTVRELLGLKLVFDENTAEKDKLEKVSRIEIALGMHGLTILEKKGIVTLRVTDSATVGRLMGKENAKEGYTMTSVVVNTSKLEKEADKVNSLAKDLDVVDRSAYHRWEPLTKAELDRKIVNIRRNPFTKAPEQLVDAVKEYSSYTWHVKLNPSIKAMMEQGAEKIKQLEGYVSEEEMDGMIYEEKESAKGKNLAISREVDTMFEVLDELTGEAPRENNIWFDWFIVKSFRTMLDSRGFQPQAKKLHRSLVYTDEMESEIDIENNKDMELLKIGIAQAMGYDIDKHHPKDSIAIGEELLKLDPAELESKIFQTKKDAQYLNIGGVALKRPVLTHALDGVAAIREYQNAKADGNNKFTTQLTIEVDGITNGALLKMIQLLGGKLTNSKRHSKISNEEYLAKAGFLTDDKVEMGQIRDKNAANYKPDSYITLQEAVKEDDIEKALAEDTPAELVEIVETAGGPKALAGQLVGVLGKFTRDMAKYAHMPFWYSAGKKKIKAEIAEVLLKDLATKFMKAKAAGETDTNVAILAKTLGVDKVTVDQWKNVPMTKIMVTVGGEEISVRQLLKAATESTYGAAMWNALETEFSDIIKLNNSINEAVRIMFAVWKSAYDDRIKKLGESVTRDKRAEILNELLELFPTVKTVVSTGVADSLALFKTAIVSREEKLTEYGAIKAHYNKDGNVDAYTSGEVILDYIAAVAAGSVLPIHAEDSANVTQAVKNALHMWDAAMLGLKQVIPTTSKFNETTFENSIKWSMLEEMRISLTRVLGSKEGEAYINNLIATAEDDNADAEKRVAAFSTLTTIEDSLRQLDEAIEANKEFKQDLVDNIQSVQHIQFTKDAEYRPNNTNNTRNLEEERKKARKAELDIIMQTLDKLPVSFKSERKEIAKLLEGCE